MITRTLAAAAALSAAVLLAVAPSAQADDPLSAADLQAARAVAADPSTLTAVTDFLGSLQAREGRAAGVAPAAVREEVVPVYTLSPEFVSGAAGARPGRLAYLAVAASADGRTSTIQTVRGDDGRWTVANLASGDRESRLAAALPAGATLLHEPQVDAWYAERGGELTVLDAGGGGRKAGERLEVADYQRAVAKAYRNKQSGSRYATEGMAGGFSQPSGGDPAPGTSAGDPVLPLLALGALAAFGAAAFVLRSRHRA
ncbi:hypothetical protein [Lentzea sp. NPDC055074]